ncbi:hypothetical protein [Microvirga sp. 17 mud 1-3]|uniref:hypothetical protein n=1 Tax=Microvirga sp. 17 mud 1-3 TaxID=2082949 RepID=UPI000D6D605E|nr:hypothetical protein [Microvirga sp. 17 mud 1-3]AWM87576.1 hypothetical protein C4E04_13080 [Microvirga sp. 17 mud 1-3]
MMDGLGELAPIAAASFLGLCLVWLLWRALRRLVAPRAERQEPAFSEPVPQPVEPVPARREPVLAPSQPGPSQPVPQPSVPDAADILALKASIDALTRQIASLEKRLVPAHSNEVVVEKPVPSAARPLSVDILAEVPLVVPERRR